MPVVTAGIVTTPDENHPSPRHTKRTPPPQKREHLDRGSHEQHRDRKMDENDVKIRIDDLFGHGGLLR